MDVLIVGAGMAGLVAAQALRKRGLSVLLVDKGRTVGGRLATRRIGPGYADTGAQFFTVRHGQFQAQVAGWLERGLVYVWAHGWASGSGEPQVDGHPRYAVKGGMNALARDLQGDLPVQFNVKVSALSPVRNGWQVSDAEGRIFASRAVLLTTPVPQALTFVETGRTPMKASDLNALRAIKYTACLAGLYWLDGGAGLPEPGGLQNPTDKVSWAADNQRKGISADATILTVHGSAEYSQAAYRTRDQDALAQLLAELKPWLGATEVREAQLKRWRYAQATVLHPQRCLVAEGVPPLVFAGDAFQEPRVEGAALSGLTAAEALSGILS
jgi:predicted NAD/FAD-dependent oxidoreductase